MLAPVSRANYSIADLYRKYADAATDEKSRAFFIGLEKGVPPSHKVSPLIEGSQRYSIAFPPISSVFSVSDCLLGAVFFPRRRTDSLKR